MVLDEKDINRINCYLLRTLAPFLIILFGSCVKGSMRNDSDVDIGFLSRQDHDAYQVFMTAQEMAAIIGRDVDLVDLSTVSTVMKAQIVSSGKIIYCSDEVSRIDFFMKALKEYAVLNERRQPVLARISGQGGGVR